MLGGNCKRLVSLVGRILARRNDIMIPIWKCFSLCALNCSTLLINAIEGMIASLLGLCALFYTEMVLAPSRLWGWLIPENYRKAS